MVNSTPPKLPTSLASLRNAMSPAEEQRERMARALPTSIYLTLFWLGKEGPLIEKAAASTKEEAIKHAQELLVALKLPDAGHETYLLGLINGWNGQSTTTFETPTGRLIQTVVRMGGCHAQG